jgi:16S rRNA processing protein RimM
VGRLRRPHGVHGEIQMDVLTDFPERIRPGATLFAGPEHTPLKVRAVRWHNRVMLIAFTGLNTPEQVGELRSQILSVTADDRPPLEEDEYYYHQIIGLRVIDDEGRLLGTVSSILETGANDVYVIVPGAGEPGTGAPGRPARELLLPATEETILAVDLDKGEMKVHLLPGLLEE